MRIKPLAITVLLGVICSLSVAERDPSATPKAAAWRRTAGTLTAPIVAKVRVPNTSLRVSTEHPRTNNEKRKTKNESSLLPIVAQPDILPEDQIFLDRVLRALPRPCREGMRHLVVRYPSLEPGDIERGQSTATTVILRGPLSGLGGTERTEMIAVIVHETCGHSVDLGLLQGSPRAGESSFPDGWIPTYRDDPSVRFYRISWLTAERQHRKNTRANFVSGYARHDPFEDFAETATMYVLQNATLRALAESNEMLAAKEAFMRDEVFGPDFVPFPGIPLDLGEERVWDVTKLPHGFDF